MINTIEVYVCLSCFETFYLPTCVVEPPYWPLCPKSSCQSGENPGTVIEVDELMSETIIELNKKGYETEWCCSGHMMNIDIESSSLNISFSREIEYVIRGICPEGFSFISAIEVQKSKDPNNKYTPYSSFCDIEYKFETIKKSLSHSEKIIIIAKKNRDIYEWALNLPNINDLL